MWRDAFNFFNSVHLFQKVLTFGVIINLFGDQWNLLMNDLLRGPKTQRNWSIKNFIIELSELASESQSKVTFQ